MFAAGVSADVEACMGHLIVAFLVLLTAFLAIATLLAILFPRAPLLGVSQHWGLQLWWLSLLAAIIEIAIGAWWMAIPAIAATLYWGVRLFGRRRVRMQGGRAMLRIVSANLLHTNTDYDRAVRALSALDAGVVVTCEVTPQARAALRALEAQFPHVLDTCRPNGLYGIAIFSRFPLTLRSRGEGGDSMPRHLAVDLDVGGRIIALVAIHPTNPLWLDSAHRIPGEFAATAALCRAAPAELVLIGDCNIAGWSHWARLLESEAGVGNDRRIRPSWPRWLPAPIRLPLDHVWVRGRVQLAAARLGKPLGSDHLPLIADLAWLGEVNE
jgi:endonuclease/exonuclease/phosphatase (EEP) superfamily protein YafD